jgi:hypothetical protein
MDSSDADPPALEADLARRVRSFYVEKQPDENFPGSHEFPPPPFPSIRVTWVTRVRAAPAVVRRTPSSGRPAHSHSSRSTTARGSPDDSDLPEDLEAQPLPKEVRAELHRRIREEHFRREPALAAARFAPLAELARDQRLCSSMADR